MLRSDGEKLCGEANPFQAKKVVNKGAAGPKHQKRSMKGGQEAQRHLCSKGTWHKRGKALTPFDIHGCTMCISTKSARSSVDQS
jgi:hypothetical protein